ncbi:Macrolide export ATP-binding/permease protein MacB [Adhaeribacter pallidiroseus]|uniref:Macrolide export ATP-binding/permease protein MacB n=2 Tax=Adhaeribacter pallidiroseus TaxID=2072847 RepID=A0A369QP61_9BACT|nr:Macrolide export ATP-binding/permease protein MacB [Adhaeribacter pallidiroseus]
MGMAAFLLILQYVRYELSYDTFHEKSKQIYRVGTTFYREGTPTEYAGSFLGLGPALKAEFPEVQAFTRLSFRRSVVSYQNHSFTEPNLFFVDPGFLAIFSLPLQPGSKQTLAAPNEVILSQSMARKYFGSEDPLGKIITLKSKLYSQNVTVTGVFADLPANSHLALDFLVSVPTLASHLGPDRLNGWDSLDHLTYILLAPGADIKNLKIKLPAFIDKYLGKIWGAESGLGVGPNRTAFALQPLRDIHLHSTVKNEAEASGSYAVVQLLLFVAIFILLLALINYVNLATARAMERAKEVAVRKVIGALRRQLTTQFFVEAVLLNLAGVVLAFTLVQVAGPWLNALVAKPFYVFSWSDYALWLSYAGILALSSFLSGLYPALVLSGYQPAPALKGKGHAAARTFSLRKGLITLQFVVAVLLLSGTYAVYRQMQFMRAYHLGMNLDQLLVVKVPQQKVADSVFSKNTNFFKNQLLSLPAVSRATLSSSVPNTDMYSTLGAVGPLGSKPADIGFSFNHIYTDADFIPAYGMQILAGRNFSKDFSTDKNNLILSEAAIKILGFKNPAAALNQKIEYEGEKQIIGVIKDFHQYSVAQEIAPVILELRFTDQKYFSAKVNPGQISQTIAAVEHQYEQLYPGYPFEYFFMDAHFAKQYEADQRFGRLFSLFSGLAVFIACLGLFGLVSYATVQRSKEIGVRKVLGATVASILTLLAKDFLKLVLLANLVAWPVAWWLIHEWLANYARHIPINTSFFLFPAVAIVLFALFTISYQAIKAALANPVEALRNE